MKTMQKTLLTLLLAPLVAVAGLGCVVDSHGRAVGVVVPAVHVHDDHCGHYYHGDRWHHHSGHRHGHGCGHTYVGGRWILRIN